jgi:hypothetical protein
MRHYEWPVRSVVPTRKPWVPTRGTCREYVADLRIRGITPHVAQNIQTRRSSAIDGRTARHRGYAQAINARKRIEQVFGWIKQSAGLQQLKARGRSKVGAVFRLHVVAYNLIRITNQLRAQKVMA